MTLNLIALLVVAVFFAMMFSLLFHQPKPAVDRDLMANEDYAFTVVILALLGLVAFYSYCWYHNESDLVGLNHLLSTILG